MADVHAKKRDVLPHDSEGHSVGEVVKDLGASTKSLIQSEVDLARVELKESFSRLGRHSAQAAIFGALLSLSVFPFLAFLVVGLGRIMNGNYWLSSLIIGVICAVVGGTMAYRAYSKMKNDDFTLPRTRETIKEEAGTVTEKVRDIRDTTHVKARGL